MESPDPNVILIPTVTKDAEVILTPIPTVTEDTEVTSDEREGKDES